MHLTQSMGYQGLGHNMGQISKKSSPNEWVYTEGRKSKPKKKKRMDTEERKSIVLKFQNPRGCVGQELSKEDFKRYKANLTGIQKVKPNPVIFEGEC